MILNLNTQYLRQQARLNRAIGTRSLERPDGPLLFEGEFTKFCKKYGKAWVDYIEASYDINESCLRRRLSNNLMKFTEFCFYWGIPSNFAKRLKARPPARIK